MEAEHDTDFTCAEDPTRREGTEQRGYGWRNIFAPPRRTKVHRKEGGRTTLYSIPSPFLSCFQYQEGRGINHEEKDPKSGDNPAKFIEDT